MKTLDQYRNILAALDPDAESGPYATIVSLIAKHEADLALVEEREPELERRSQALQEAEAARLAALHEHQHPTRDDETYLLKIDKANTLAELHWRFARQAFDGFEPAVRAAKMRLAGGSQLPREFREATRATESLLQSIVAWGSGGHGGAIHTSNGFTQPEVRAHEQAGVLSTAAVTWLPYTERALLASLPEWRKKNPRFPLADDELEHLFARRRKSIEERRRVLIAAAGKASREAAELAGHQQP
ncbi:MAG: hypothetical protein IT377_27795 [Polyangiaceae bacterium]|nr:hypothetical protein [Polyangiaceae bacterium]